MSPKPFSISARFKSFIYAFNGLKAFVKSEHNAWLHMLAAVIAIIAGFYFSVSKYDWCWLLLAIALVFIAEVINTAIEKLTDMVSPGYNEKAKIVKDLAAGAVLIAALFAVSIALMVFIPYLKF